MISSSSDLCLQWRGVPVVIVDPDPASGGAGAPSVYSAYMQAWWPYPAEEDVPELTDTEMASLIVSFSRTSMT